MIELKLLILAGGCFWCTEAMFLSLNGVEIVESGYAGGTVENPTYKQVCSGTTGHAECVAIYYDENIISMEDLIDIHMHTHDPTTLNRQGADVGTQYRSAIFYETPEQKKKIEAELHKLQKDFDRPIVTTIEKLDKFYPAEDYHQNYYARNKDKNPYCQLISDKVYKLMQKYPKRIKTTQEE